MLVPRLLTQQTSEAMHVQGNDGQSNRSGKSLRTFRPNAVEATVFKIVDGRLHSGVLTAHGSKGFTLFAVLISLAEVALLGQDVVNKHFIKAGAVRLAVESANKKSTEIAYGITSVPKDRGTPEKLLAWNRGHWSIENNNHRVRDVNFKEDACLSRTMHAPNNGAICNCIALAIILSRGPKIAETRRYFNLHRHEAVKAVLSPG